MSTPANRTIECTCEICAKRSRVEVAFDRMPLAIAVIALVLIPGRVILDLVLGVLP